TVGGPNDRPFNAARLVIGTRDAKWQTMFVDREVFELGIHRETSEVKGIFQRAALAHAFLYRRVESGNKISRELDSVLDHFRCRERCTASRHKHAGLQFGEMIQRRKPVGEVGISAITG